MFTSQQRIKLLFQRAFYEFQALLHHKIVSLCNGVARINAKPFHIIVARIRKLQRHKNVIRVWQDADEAIKDALLEGLDKYNDLILSLIKSGDSELLSMIEDIKELNIMN